MVRLVAAENLNFKNRNTSFPTKASAPWQGTERGMEACSLRQHPSLNGQG